MAMSARLGLRRGPVWAAGSTHPGEDKRVLNAHARVLGRHPESRLLLIPRHPVRAKAVATLAQRLGFRVSWLGSATPRPGIGRSDDRRAEPEPGTARPAESNDDHPADSSEPQVIVCDTMGELQTLYGLSDVAFLGGSLVPSGGHNPIEAALCGQPLIVGPHTFNFDEVFETFASAGCLTRVGTETQLAEAVIAAFDDADARAAAGRRALQVVQNNRGASERLLDLLRTWIRGAIT